MLLQTGRYEEAIELFDHAQRVFEQYAPDHHLLEVVHTVLPEVRRVLGQSIRQPNLQVLARLALRARNGTELDNADRETLDEGLDALAADGPPFDTVFAHLRAVADGGGLPSISECLPQPVAQFLASIRDAAQSIDDAKP